MGVYYGSEARVMRSVYRDMMPRTMQFLAETLQQVFGVAGLTVAKLKARERQQRDAEKQSFHDALDALT